MIRPLLLVLVLVASGLGCAAVRTACSVVDAVHAACIELRYVDPAGRSRRVHVSRDELVGFGEAMRAARGEDGLGAPDAGPDGSLR